MTEPTPDTPESETHRHGLVEHTHARLKGEVLRVHEGQHRRDTPESELTLREALEWALDNLEAEDEFLGYAEGIRKARAVLATPESELTGDGLRTLAARWQKAADSTMERALVGDPAAAMAAARILRSCAAGLLAALPNREAAPREGLDDARPDVAVLTDDLRRRYSDVIARLDAPKMGNPKYGMDRRAIESDLRRVAFDAILLAERLGR